MSTELIACLLLLLQVLRGSDLRAYFPLSLLLLLSRLGGGAYPSWRLAHSRCFSSLPRSFRSVLRILSGAPLTLGVMTTGITPSIRLSATFPIFSSKKAGLYYIWM